MPFSAGALGPSEALQPHQGNARGARTGSQQPPDREGFAPHTASCASCRHPDPEQDARQLDALALRHNCSSSAVEGQRSNPPTQELYLAHRSQPATQLLQKGAAFGCKQGGTKRSVTNNPHPFSGAKCIFLSPTKNQCCFAILTLFWAVFLFSSRAYKTTLELVSPTWLTEDLRFTR